MNTFSQTSHLVEQKAAIKSEPQRYTFELNETQKQEKPTDDFIAVVELKKALEESKELQENFSLKGFEAIESR